MTFKQWLVVGAVVGAGMLGYVGYYQWRALRQELALAQLRNADQVELNDSTRARLAATVLAKDSLAGLLATAHTMGGTLVAGVTVYVPVHDTTIIHDTLPTSLSGDSTRTATVHDSTFAGVLTGVITAPPCCKPLAFHYTLTRPAFAPSIGWVQVGDSTVVVVIWQGQELRVGSPYARPLPKRPRLLGGFLEGLYNPLTRTLATRGGVELRLPAQFAVQGAVEQQQGGNPGVWVGLRKSW